GRLVAPGGPAPAPSTRRRSPPVAPGRSLGPPSAPLSARSGRPSGARNAFPGADADARANPEHPADGPTHLAASAPYARNGRPGPVQRRGDVATDGTGPRGSATRSLPPSRARPQRLLFLGK